MGCPARCQPTAPPRSASAATSSTIAPRIARGSRALTPPAMRRRVPGSTLGLAVGSAWRAPSTRSSPPPRIGWARPGIPACAGRSRSPAFSVPTRITPSSLGPRITRPFPPSTEATASTATSVSSPSSTTPTPSRSISPTRPRARAIRRRISRTTPRRTTGSRSATGTRARCGTLRVPPTPTPRTPTGCRRRRRRWMPSRP